MKDIFMLSVMTDCIHRWQWHPFWTCGNYFVLNFWCIQCLIFVCKHKCSFNNSIMCILMMPLWGHLGWTVGHGRTAKTGKFDFSLPFDIFPPASNHLSLQLQALFRVYLPVPNEECCSHFDRCLLGEWAVIVQCFWIKWFLLHFSKHVLDRWRQWWWW